MREPGAEGAERFASAVGGWMLLMLPLSGVLVLFAIGRFVDPLMRERGARWNRRTYALVDFAKFLATIGVTMLLALAVSGWPVVAAAVVIVFVFDIAAPV